MSAKIYLSDHRGRHEFAGFRSLHMFNFGDFRHIHRQSSGDLYIFNEDTLAGGKRYELTAEADSLVVIIPVAGAVICNDRLVAPGESMILDSHAGEKLQFLNPYEKEDELVNFIQLWFRKTGTVTPANAVYSFDITIPDRMASIFHRQDTVFSIGKFKGRSSGIYKKKNLQKDLFVYVVEGVFEVEDRLLHAGDGLALNDFDSMEFEALSNDAIILVTEVSKS